MPKSRASKSSDRFAVANAATFTTTRTLRMACIIFFLFCAGLTIASAQTFISLLSFDGPDGAFPQGTLVGGIDGNFYGATPYGGIEGAGNIFKVTPDGETTMLYSFCSRPRCADGSGTYSALIWGRDGNLYGTTFSGGKNGHGTAFEVTPTGKLTTLYNFCSQSNCADGATPYAALARGSNGNLYGSTFSGGTHNYGTIFELTPRGVLTTLYNFCSQPNCTDGQGMLLNNLVQGRDGNFYGTTPLGGATGSGTVFKITSKGNFTTLYNFCSQPNCADGADPSAGLLMGRDGNFYGTTAGGTVFGITAKGKFATLYSFSAQTNSSGIGDTMAALVQ